MMCKTKTNHNLVASIFLHFRQFGWFSVDVFLALKSILLSSDWPFMMMNGGDDFDFSFINDT